MGYFAINQSDGPEVIDILVNKGYRDALKKVGCNGRYMLTVNTKADALTLKGRLKDVTLKRMPDSKYPRGGDHDFTGSVVVTKMLKEALREAFSFYGNQDFASAVEEGLRKGIIDTMYKREDYLINQYLPQWKGLNIEPYRIAMGINITIYHIVSKQEGELTVIYDCFPKPELTAVRDPNPPTSLEMLFG